MVFRELGSELEIPAIKKWTRDYLSNKLAEQEVTIAMTPNGCV